MMKSALRIGALVFLGIIGIVIYARHRPVDAPPPSILKPKPSLPVAVTFRKALAGTGDVAQLKNNSGHIMAVIVRIRRPQTQPWDKSLTLDPAKTFEIGHMEGWAFAPGDVLEISADGYESARVTLSQ